MAKETLTGQECLETIDELVSERDILRKLVPDKEKWRHYVWEARHEVAKAIDYALKYDGSQIGGIIFCEVFSAQTNYIRQLIEKN